MADPNIFSPDNRSSILKRKITKIRLYLFLVALVLTIVLFMAYKVQKTDLSGDIPMNPGYMGKAVRIDTKSLTKTQLSLYADGWKRNAFNQFVSDMIPLERQLADIRDFRCKNVDYNPIKLLPKTSVIMCFHNEAWSTLLRSIYSVLNRSPRELLHEVILVDDNSDLNHLKKPLDDHLSKLNDLHNDRERTEFGTTTEHRVRHDRKNINKFIKIVRKNQREGLIRARLAGVDLASGEVLTFLDSHIECSQGWLEPLLNRIYQDAWAVVSPVIDSINEDTFEFSRKSNLDYLNVGGFDWNLQFSWHLLPEREKKLRALITDPVRTPTIAGGIFSINREFFNRLGRYDDGFEIWGGENLELSFKTWMCGGRLEIVPCSHVGHVFRSRSPYQWKPGVNVIKRNNVRLAEVWMDEYKSYYYTNIGNDLGDYGDITKRKELRKQLKCKPFSFYVREVYPDLTLPNMTTDRN